jgi:hypothetical protein
MMDRDLRGGLFNQLMAFAAYLELARLTNRTLATPEFRTEFPGTTGKRLRCGFEDIYDIGLTIDEWDAAFSIAASRQAPSGIFATQPKHVALQGRQKMLGPQNSKPDAVLRDLAKIIKEHDDEGMVVVETFTQVMSHGVLVQIYEKLKLSRRLSGLVEDHHRLLVPDSNGHSWDSVTGLHLRIEKGWLQRYEDHHRQPRVYLTLEQIQAKFANSTDLLSGPGPQTLLLSYAAGQLPTPVSNLQHGWPAGLRVVTTDDLNEIIGGLNYLDQSILMSKVMIQSRIFVWNLFSSFSQIIAAVRDSREDTNRRLSHAMPTARRSSL